MITGRNNYKEQKKWDKIQSKRDSDLFDDLEGKTKICKRYASTLRSIYPLADLLELHGILNVGGYLGLNAFPDSLVGDKIFRLAYHFYEYRKVISGDFEDLPLLMGVDEDMDKIIAWRFKLGK